MAYTPTTWKDRNVQYPNRYVDELGNTKSFTPSPGTVTEVGTQITADRMNKIEQGILSAIPADQKAVANGVATLDAGGAVPSDQLANVISATEDSAIVWELIARRVFTTDGTTFFFTGIPTEYTALKLVAKARSGDYSDSALGIKINGVIDGYAYKTTLNGVTTSASSQTKISFTDAIRSFNATGDRTCTIEMVFSSLPTGHQDFYGFSNNINQGQLSIIGEWISGQITSMEISSTDGFDAGSVVLLFGCKNLWT